MSGGIVTHPLTGNVVISGNKILAPEGKVLSTEVVKGSDPYGGHLPNNLYVEIVHGERQGRTEEERQETFLCTANLTWNPSPGMKHASELRSWVLRRGSGQWTWAPLGHDQVKVALKVLESKFGSAAVNEVNAPAVMQAESRAIDAAFLPAVRLLVKELVLHTRWYGHPADLLRELASELDAETVHGT